MNAYPEKQQYTADDLAAIIAILRDPENGCPWDKVQTHTSIRMNFLEEAYEAVDAIDLDDPELMCEELGDVLMQVAFHAQIEREAGQDVYKRQVYGYPDFVWRFHTGHAGLFVHGCCGYETADLFQPPA